MQKFLVTFKNLDKKYQIESQDDATAKKWADRQLEVWKKKDEYSVALVKSPEKKEDSAIINAPAKKPKPRPDRRRSAN